MQLAGTALKAPSATAAFSSRQGAGRRLARPQCVQISAKVVDVFMPALSSTMTTGKPLLGQLGGRNTCAGRG